MVIIFECVIKKLNLGFTKLRNAVNSSCAFASMKRIDFFNKCIWQFLSVNNPIIILYYINSLCWKIQEVNENIGIDYCA